MDWGQIIFLVLGSSLIATLISKIFDLFQADKERKNILAREIYFHLQERAEKILFGMQVLMLRMNYMNAAVRLKFENNIFDTSPIEEGRLDDRVNLAVYLEIYFPNVDLKDYNRCIEMFKPATIIYDEFVKSSGQILKERATELNNIVGQFEIGMRGLSIKIQEQLDIARQNIK
jgi:hypothetical protein